MLSFTADALLYVTPDWEEGGKKKRFQGQNFKYVMPWLTCLRLVFKRGWKIVKENNWF